VDYKVFKKQKTEHFALFHVSFSTAENFGLNKNIVGEIL